MHVPPILIYLSRETPPRLFWPFVTYVVFLFFQQYGHGLGDAPRWMVAVACIASTPLVTLVSRLYTDARDARLARQNGAELGNLVQGSAWANMKAIVRSSNRPHSQSA